MEWLAKPSNPIITAWSLAVSARSFFLSQAPHRRHHSPLSETSVRGFQQDFNVPWFVIDAAICPGPQLQELHHVHWHFVGGGPPQHLQLRHQNLPYCFWYPIMVLRSSNHGSARGTIPTSNCKICKLERFFKFCDCSDIVAALIWMLICKEDLVNKYHTGRCHEQEGNDLKWHLDS